MPRQAHYWRKAGAQSAPSEIVVFDCETHFGDAAKVDGGELQTLRLGYAMAYRLEKGRRTRFAELVFRKGSEFWAFVRKRLNKRRPVWVFGHNLPYDLGCVGGWKVICGAEYKTEKACVTGQMFFVKGSLNGMPLHFCDTINYYRCSLKQLGKSVGLAKMDMPEYAAPDEDWIHYCKNDVEVTALGLDSLIRFLRTNALGPWQPSIAGLAFSAFRSCFMKHKVLVHDYKPVLELERGAYYGGLVDTPRVGKVPAARVWELDVCSMYPSVCRNVLPTRLVNWSARMGLPALRRMLERYLCVAEVDLNTATDPYPVRLKRGTYYPTGLFRTTLAYPELTQAVGRGHVKYVHRAAWYEGVPVFEGYMRWMVDHKEKFKRSGDEAFSTLCKYYANSLYGKTGQLTPQWQEWGESSLRHLEGKYGQPPGVWEKWYDNPPDMYEIEETVRLPGMPESVPIRNYWGITEIKCGESESRESCPIIAATVTSYARVLLRSLQTIAGADHWFYCDTDSIWVDDTGKERLEAAGMVRPGELGYLDCKGEHQWMIVHGPKDYETDRVVRLKGVRATATRSESGGYCQLQFPSALVQLRDGRDNGVFVRHVEKHLARTITKSVVDASGGTRPLKFPLENPERVRRGKRERPKKEAG